MNVPKALLATIGKVDWRAVADLYKKAKLDGVTLVQLLDVSDAIAYMRYVENMPVAAIVDQFAEHRPWYSYFSTLQRLDHDARPLMDITLPATKRLSHDDAVHLIRSSPVGQHLRRGLNLLGCRKGEGKNRRYVK